MARCAARTLHAHLRSRQNFSTSLYPCRWMIEHRGAEIRAALARIGQPIGAYDVLIAAIALANDLTLITHNVAEFSRIAGLRYEDWEAGDAPASPLSPTPA